MYGVLPCLPCQCSFAMFGGFGLIAEQMDGAFPHNYIKGKDHRSACTWDGREWEWFFATGNLPESTAALLL